MAKHKSLRILVGIVIALFLITSVAESVSVDIVEMRGPTLTGLTNDPVNYSNNIMNYSNFAGFYYNFDENVAGEEISVIVDTGSRNVSPHNLTYTSTIMNINYSSDNLRKSDDSKFEMIEYFGEEYVPISAGQADKLSKLLINEGDSINYTIKPGYSIELGENYIISLVQIDIDGDKAWLELTKNGVFVDDEIISVKNPTDYASKTWNYDKDFGSISNVVTLRIHIDDVVQSSTGTFVVIEGIWQISDNAMEIITDDVVGKLKVTGVGSAISMDNSDSFVLSKNAQIDITNNLSFNVADSNELVFHMVKEYTAPGTYEVRGTVWDVPAGIPQTKEWTYENFGAFYYDLSSNIGYENITIIVGPLDNRTVDKGNITYTSTIKDVNYNYTLWTSTYQKIGYFGEEYVPIKTDKANKISKLLLDDDNYHTIINGESLELGEGYAITVEDIDLIGNKTLLNLTKNGNFVEKKWINVNNDIVNSTWNYTHDIAGETNVESIRINIDLLFQSQDAKALFIKGLWQISDTVEEITPNDKIGILNVSHVSGDKIVMKSSDDAVNLTRGTIINITQDIKFRVANDEIQTRIYPFTELKIDGIAPVLSLDIPQSFNGSNILTINLSTSPYSDSLKYSTNATFGILNGNIFKWIPAFVDNSTYDVQFTVSDGIYTDSNVVSIPIVHEITSPAEQWNRSFGGVNYFPASDVKQTNDGGYIFTGKTYSFGTGYGDFWLLKTDPDGDETWNKTFWKGNSSNVYTVQQTNDSGYILAGYADSPANEHSYDAWFIKTDSDGNEIWNQSYGGPDSDFVKDIQQTNDGGYILAGYTYSFGQGLNDAWLIKTDSDGIELWNKTFGGVDSDFLNDVQQTSDGGFILAGYIRMFDIDDKDAWLIKTDSDGIELWNKTFGGVSYDSANGVKQTNDSGYILAGYTESFGQGQSDAWLIKTDSDGIELWNKTFGGVSYDSANDVKQTIDGGYIVAGQTSSFGIGDNDAWLIKTDENGNHVWNNMFWRGSGDSISSIQQTSDWGYILAGYTHLFEENEHNIWLMKIEGHAPTLASIGPQTINEAVTLTINLFATDPDGDALNYTTNATFGTLTDNIFKWTPTYSDSGIYHINFTVSDGIFVDNEIVTITVSDVQVQTDSNSGGGGGGSGSSGEDYENIKVKDVVRKQIISNEETLYEFKEELNAIETIKFTALKNSGEISATIEVLKGRSSLVKSDPSGQVYQNMNIWVGKSGFATPNNIANVMVGFKVEKLWIEANGIVVSTISLCRYHDDVWNSLPTKKIGEDDKYIYLEAETLGFSPFSITGSAEEEVAAEGSAVSLMLNPTTDSISSTAPEQTGTQLPNEGVSMVWFVVGVLLVMLIGGGAYWMYRTKNDTGEK